jgi:hypothetical protein
VSWTIYGGFTYILTTLIFILVTGWQNWGTLEYTTVAGGPVLLWGVRRLLTLWYEYRISNTQDYLDSLNKERDATIEKLKSATKYNSTQDLIDKYSSKPTTPKQSPEDKRRRQSQGGQGPPQGPQRVFTQPPPTANIPRGPPQQLPPGVPNRRTSAEPATAGPSFQPPKPPGPTPGAEFAPNAFSDPPPTAPPTYGETTWYDRILDALLGEDETSAKNRFALICSNCKLVNGQAPPGAKTLEDVGKWRCNSCGAMNGVESETAKLVKEVSKAEAAGEHEPEEEDDDPVTAGVDDEEESGDEGEEIGNTKSPAASTRSKAQGVRKRSSKKSG